MNELDKKLDVIEKQMAKNKVTKEAEKLMENEESPDAMTQLIDGIKSKVITDKLYRAIPALVKQQEEIKEKLEELKDSNTETKKVTVENIGQTPKTIEVVNWPEPIKEVTVKNPQEEVEIKNWPKQKKFPVNLIVDGLTKTIATLPKAIVDHIKQVTQPVVVSNKTLDVFVLDPKTGKRVHPGGSSYAAVSSGGGGGSESKSAQATTTSVTVGDTSTAVVASNGERIKVILINDSNETIYLAYGADAVANQGVRLNASGGSIVEGEFTGAINAICSSGSKNLTVIDHIK